MSTCDSPFVPENYNEHSSTCLCKLISTHLLYTVCIKCHYFTKLHTFQISERCNLNYLLYYVLLWFKKSLKLITFLKALDFATSYKRLDGVCTWKELRVYVHRVKIERGKQYVAAIRWTDLLTDRWRLC